MGTGMKIPVKWEYRYGYDAADEDVNAAVPVAYGPGAEYDWDFVGAHETARAVYE